MFEKFKKNYESVAVTSITEISMMSINPNCIPEKLDALRDIYRDGLNFDTLKVKNPDLLMEYIIGTYYFADIIKRAKIEETKTILMEMASGNMSLDDYCKQCPNKSEEDCEDCKACRDAGKDN